MKSYYTSRTDIISWINNVLGTSLTKIEQLGSGSIYCHLLDAAYPQKVPLQKVKWNTYRQIDSIHNFKILQNSFQHVGLQKRIQISKLIKGKYQDNWEFIQWMKKTLDNIIEKNKKSYNALVRRRRMGINFDQAKMRSNFTSATKNSERNFSMTKILKSTLVSKQNNNQYQKNRYSEQVKKHRKSSSELAKIRFFDQLVNSSSMKSSIYSNSKERPISYRDEKFATKYLIKDPVVFQATEQNQLI